MAKQSQIDRAIANLDAQIEALQLAKRLLEGAKDAKKPTKRPAKVVKSDAAA